VSWWEWWLLAIAFALAVWQLFVAGKDEEDAVVVLVVQRELVKQSFAEILRERGMAFDGFAVECVNAELADVLGALEQALLLAQERRL
jgi:hypothetical protein